MPVDLNYQVPKTCPNKAGFGGMRRKIYLIIKASLWMILLWIVGKFATEIETFIWMDAKAEKIDNELNNEFAKKEL